MPDEEFWQTLGFVRRSDNRKNIIKELDRPLIPKEIAEETDMHQSNVSRALKELKEKDIVEVLNPEAKTGRLYQLTGKGDKIRKEL